MTCSQIFEDSYGSVIDHVDEGFVEIRWYDSTADMTPKEFKNWLVRFTDLLDGCSARRILVDATSFKMDRMGETMGWREEAIIPRYNSLGINKFAFHLPGGAPSIGATPAPEGPAEFPTGYFATRAETTEWLVT